LKGRPAARRFPRTGLTAVLAAVGRFNAAYPWSHNDAYHRWLLRQLPRRMSRTVDLGCGTGNLVRAIAARAAVAEGIDADQRVIAVARQSSAGSPGARFGTGDFMELPGDGQYDVVTALAVVHHGPLRPALIKMRSLLAPGGTIIILGCYRPVTTLDFLTGLVAAPVNMLIGFLKSGQAAAARVAMSAPVKPPDTDLAEVRRAAAEVLPGARVRRRLFWRYSLTYTAPAGQAGVSRRRA
jgi:SAM-dependent methyltransferase